MKLARRPQPPIELPVVPGCGEMDDEIMYKHLNARHKRDLGISTEMTYSPLYAEGLVGAHRAFHRRVHEVAVPQQHDHEHGGVN